MSTLTNISGRRRHYLINHSIQPATRSKYSSAYRQFIGYLRRQHVRIDQLSPHQLDAHLVDYVHHLHSIGVPYTTAQYVMSSVIRHTGMKDSFHRTRLSLKGWRRLIAGKRRHRPPLTLEMSTLIAVVLAKSGHVNAAIATLLSFHTYLRINEMSNLLVSDILFAGDPRFGSAMSVYGTVRLSRTKTGENQCVNITDLQVATVLYEYIQPLNLHLSRSATRQSLFGLSASRYRSLFHSAVDALQCGDIGYSPHCLRHGGATHDFMKNVPLLHIMYRGRWRSESSLRTYVNTGAVLLFATRMSRTQLDAAHLFMQYICDVMKMFIQSRST